MRKLITSFRFKITVSLVIVISFLSFFSFYIFNNSINKIVHKDNETHIISLLNILKDQFYYSLSNHDNKIIFSLLQNTQNNENVINTYLINSDGFVTYPDKFKSLSLDSLSNGDSSVLSENIKLLSFESGEKHFARAFIQMQNSTECFSCHSPDKSVLGYVIIDFSTEETEKSLVFVQKFSLYFTIIMVVVIIGLVILMHYRVVKTSLSQFEYSINEINNGNLGERITIPKSEELGRLAKSFNDMVSTFQRTQEELFEYHKKEMENKNKMATIGMMASRLAHEIRNPLAGIDNATEIIVDQMQDDEHKPILIEIRRQAKRVNNAISNMMRFSRSRDLKLKKRDINEIIKALVFFIENQVDNKKIEFRQNLQSDIPLFPFDNEQMENVLLNLGLNAIKAISEKGIITFTTMLDSENNNVIITVEDNGEGIPESNLSTIFNAFFTTHTEGTGLGLAIAKEVVEKHKGKIWVESKENDGTVFFISLPYNQ